MTSTTHSFFPLSFSTLSLFIHIHLQSDYVNGRLHFSLEKEKKKKVFSIIEWRLFTFFTCWFGDLFENICKTLFTAFEPRDVHSVIQLHISFKCLTINRFTFQLKFIRWRKNCAWKTTSSIKTSRLFFRMNRCWIRRISSERSTCCRWC